MTFRLPLTTARASPNNGESDDLVTRWVGRIFGRDAVEDRTPFGLKRMDWSMVKELEVILDREARAKTSDDPMMKRIRPMLAGTSLEEDLRMCYEANVDGWTPQAFHSCCDGFGPTIILARTQGGALLGGYNPLGYDGYGSDKATYGAFLFTWPDGDVRSKPCKLQKVETDQLAIIDRMDQGPQFGPGDLKILLARGKDSQKITSKLIDYARPPDGRKNLFSKSETTSNTLLVELWAFVRNGGKLKYSLDGLRWKSEFSQDGSGEGPPPGVFTL